MKSVKRQEMYLLWFTPRRSQVQALYRPQLTFYTTITYKAAFYWAVFFYAIFDKKV